MNKQQISLIYHVQEEVHFLPKSLEQVNEKLVLSGDQKSHSMTKITNENDEVKKKY